MAPGTVERFESVARRTVDSCRRATPETFAATLEEVVTEPAVGVPLPFEGVSFEGTPVEVDPSIERFETASTGVTPAGMGIADYGTVTVDSRAAGDELVSLYSRRHVAVVAASDVVPDMAAAFDRLESAFESGATGRVLATGPSATADMGTLVEGVHGPESVHVVLLEER